MWMIFHKPSPVGMLTLSSDGAALTGLWLDGQKYFGVGLSDTVKENDLPVFEQASAWLDAYFAKAPLPALPPLAPQGSPFRQAVWRLLLALEKFEPPIVTIDMGTATTIGVISEGRNYEGGMLLPGVNVSLEALSRRAAQLPAISLQHPKVLIGKTTEDCMRSGIVYGTAGMLDGVIDRIREQFSGRTLSVVATGGNAPVIVKYCRNKIVYDKYLLMDGLWAIYQKNK